ncbi:hypothetical protein NDK47_25685 [Brevibacillus ruminantium]|uniref:Uncharacterized protein n=1 Tax=Brevibacillus ruminantium TaxID=2950604 RepID=A0ABY4WE78_9BACL|nr:hypothetical protein [Brevibacillus ruminantium]USG65457.1 hypothetical protein NDK47_25685 [Brevibacillus ruminantium]
MTIHSLFFLLQILHKLAQTERSFRIGYALILTHMPVIRHHSFLEGLLPDGGREASPSESKKITPTAKGFSFS